MQVHRFLILLLLFSGFSVSLLLAQPPGLEANGMDKAPDEELKPDADMIDPETAKVANIDFQSAVIGTWLESYTVIGEDTSNVVNLEGKENYWIFNQDGSFVSAARWAFTKTALMTFGEYTYSFTGNQLIWDNEPSGWEVLTVESEYLITPARFIGDKKGVTLWKKIEEIEVEEK